jgi:hypothetical protein
LDDDTRLNLLGLFASSLEVADWDYDGHPRLAAFASGLLAYERTPDEIRNDRALRKEFPACELAGLCDGKLYWRSPATIAWDREYQARCAAFEAQAAELA